MISPILESHLQKESRKVLTQGWWGNIVELFNGYRISGL
jgi:hypothetical protein